MRSQWSFVCNRYVGDNEESLKKGLWFWIDSFLIITIMITAKRSIPWLRSIVRKRLSGKSCGRIISTTASRALFICLLQYFRLVPKRMVKIPTFAFVLSLRVQGHLPGSEVGEPYLVPLLCYSSHGSMKRKSCRMNKISATKWFTKGCHGVMKTDFPSAFHVAWISSAR